MDQSPPTFFIQHGGVVVDKLLFRFSIFPSFPGIFAIKVESCQKSQRILDDFLPSQIFGDGSSKNCTKFITAASRHVDWKSFTRKNLVTGSKVTKHDTGNCQEMRCIMCIFTVISQVWNVANQPFQCKIVRWTLASINLSVGRYDPQPVSRSSEWDLSSIVQIVTTDFEAMYAYKRGDYQRCLQLSTQNVHTLLYARSVHNVPISPVFIQLLDDDIVSLSALTMIVNPKFRKVHSHNASISQLTLSLVVDL